jgi:transmembrane sensor
MDETPPPTHTPSPEPEPDWDWIARYIAGELTEGEARWVRAWADADPAHASLLAEVQQVWAASPRGGTRRQWDAEAALRQLKARTPASGDRLRVRRRVARPFAAATRFGVGAVAAAIVAAVGVAVIGIRHSRVPTIPVSPAREYAATRGERASVTLSDGTQMVIGPGSRVWITVDSVHRQREVRLDGEAMFSVRHDPTRAFVVRTARAVTRDLGTTFGVRDYASDAVARVVVREGHVAIGAADTVGRPNAEATLGQGDMGEVGSDGRVAPVKRVVADTYLAWARGTLVLDGMPIRDALTEIARWYDVDVQLADSASAERRVSASFTTESAPEALRIIGDAVGLSVERQGGAFVLVRRSSAP